MAGVKRRLAHVTPEELLLIPVIILVVVGLLTQPTAITRLFESPYATPIPGDSPADEVLDGRLPSPSPSPIGVELRIPADRIVVMPDAGGTTIVYDRSGRRIQLLPPARASFDATRRQWVQVIPGR